MNLSDMSLEDVKQEIEVLGSFNRNMNFSHYSYYGNQDSCCAYLSSKVFVIAMLAVYREMGLDISRFNLVVTDLEGGEDYFVEAEENLDENGYEVLELLKSFGWDVCPQYFDGDDYDIVGLKFFPKSFRNEFEDVLDIFSWIFEGPLKKGEERDEDYYPEGSCEFGYVSSQKLGRYLYFMNHNPDVRFEKDDIIKHLMASLSFPFNGQGYGSTALIGDTYYIGWLSGFMNEMWEKTEKDVDYYYPLYASWLDKFLDLAFIKYDILGYCEKFPAQLPPDDNDEEDEDEEEDSDASEDEESGVD